MAAPTSDYLVHIAEPTSVFFLTMGHFLATYLNSWKELTLSVGNSLYVMFVQVDQVRVSVHPRHSPGKERQRLALETKPPSPSSRACLLPEPLGALWPPGSEAQRARPSPRAQLLLGRRRSPHLCLAGHSSVYSGLEKTCASVSVHVCMHVRVHTCVSDRNDLRRQERPGNITLVSGLP